MGEFCGVTQDSGRKPHEQRLVRSFRSGLAARQITIHDTMRHTSRILPGRRKRPAGHCRAYSKLYCAVCARVGDFECPALAVGARVLLGELKFPGTRGVVERGESVVPVARLED